jgi:DegV family protein with EDD domain
MEQFCCSEELFMPERVGVVTDSHCGLNAQQARECGVFVVEASYMANGQVFKEDENFDRSAFIQQLREGIDVQTFQPSPGELAQVWDKALEQHDQIVYVPIGSTLSGSYESACALARESVYAGRVVVSDTKRVSAPQLRSVLDALELAEDGFSAEEIRDTLDSTCMQSCIYVALDTMEYLTRGGRIPKAVSLVGGALNIKPIVEFTSTGLHLAKTAHGMVKARTSMLELVQEKLKELLTQGISQSSIALIAAGSSNEAKTAKWIAQLEKSFPGMPVLYGHLPLAICCHIGPDALGVGLSYMPSKRHVQA